MSDPRRNREFGMAFEEDFAEEFGLKRVPGSGNQWHSKLDEYGFGARWSLKATQLKTFPISQDIIDEAIAACEGVGGTGEIPMWAIRIGDSSYDMVMMRANDFKRAAAEGGTFARKSKAEVKRERASIPILFRDDELPDDPF